MQLPKKLLTIKNELIGTNLHLSSKFQDGRINSAVNENTIIDLISKFTEIDKPRSRAWFDFSFTENGIFYPVNIKITTTNTADNLNCKLGIYYALTGLIPDFPNEINWLHYFELLYENIGLHKTNDYYFLVVNKEDNSDIIVNSLKGLSKIQPNGNNLPFQCKWDSNREVKKNSFNQAKDLILGTFGESIKLRADIYFNFKRYFPEYV